MIKYILGVVTLMLGALAFTAAPATAETPVQQCVGTWNVVVGGLNNNDSVGFFGVNQRVGYNSYDLRSGVNELNRLAWDHRNACPGDHIKAVGHSGGAAVVHVWATENGQHFRGRANVVLLSDPKRPGGQPGGQGFAGTDFPINVYPVVAGTDGNYGGLPALSVCQVNDHICASAASWDGYLNKGTHQKYNFDANAYGNWGNGYINLYE